MLIWTADGGKFLSMMMAIELEKTVDAGAVVIVFFYRHIYEISPRDLLKN